jgi:hypothetical protein
VKGSGSGWVWPGSTADQLATIHALGYRWDPLPAVAETARSA